jgi:hypothetical protein
MYLSARFKNSGVLKECKGRNDHCKTFAVLEIMLIFQRCWLLISRESVCHCHEGPCLRVYLHASDSSRRSFGLCSSLFRYKQCKSPLKFNGLLVLIFLSPPSFFSYFSPSYSSRTFSLTPFTAVSRNFLDILL